MKAFPFQMIPGFAFSSSSLSNPHTGACESGHHICFTVFTSARLSGSLKTATVVVCLGLPGSRGLCNSRSVGLHSRLFLFCLGLN